MKRGQSCSTSKIGMKTLKTKQLDISGPQWGAWLFHRPHVVRHLSANRALVGDANIFCHDRWNESHEPFGSDVLGQKSLNLSEPSADVAEESTMSTVIPRATARTLRFQFAPHGAFVAHNINHTCNNLIYVSPSQLAKLMLSSSSFPNHHVARFAQTACLMPISTLRVSFVRGVYSGFGSDVKWQVVSQVMRLG